MESSVADISDLKLEQKFKLFWWKLNTFLSERFPEKKISAGTPNDLANVLKCDDEEKCSQAAKQKFEAKVPQAELDAFELLYIPEYVRDIVKKRDYWQREYQYWKDLISKKKWTEYEQRFKNENNKLKTVIRNLDEEIYRMTRLKNHLSKSLDRKRLEALIEYIKAKHSNENVLQAMLQAAFFTCDGIQRAYIIFAIYATYGEYRCRPTQVKKGG